MRYGVGIKNSVTANEPHFQESFFQADKFMPGVLLIEAITQTAGDAVHRFAAE